ncbi:MAG: hypothetical protein K0Q66_799 [Chitinophagaceae bacterium]|nr:hypothetical protein [Chitinophagaceae bacterium]
MPGNLLILFIVCFFFACSGEQRKGQHALENSFLQKKTRWKKAKEIGRISYSFSGCFGSEQADLSIYLDDTTHIALLNRHESEASPNQPVENVISREQLIELENFILKLHSYNTNGGCTNTSSYEVTYNGKSFEKVITSCDFEDFDSFLSKLSFPPRRC